MVATSVAASAWMRRVYNMVKAKRLPMTLADVLPTGTFLAVSPVITASVIGGLFAFTVLYTRRIQTEAAALAATMPPEPAPNGEGYPQIPLP